MEDDTKLLKALAEFDWDRASLLKRLRLAERLTTRINENPEFYVGQMSTYTRVLTRLLESSLVRVRMFTF